MYYKWKAYYPLTVLNKIYTKNKVLLSFAGGAGASETPVQQDGILKPSLNTVVLLPKLFSTSSSISLFNLFQTEEIFGMGITGTAGQGTCIFPREAPAVPHEHWPNCLFTEKHCTEM